MTSCTVACLQNTAERETEPTLVALGDMVRRARDMGADLIAAPEVCSYLEPRRRLVLEKAEPQDDHRGLHAFRGWARETGAWLLAGSMVTRTEEERLANRSYLLDPQGEVVATYDKIHMFDVDIGEGDRYRESRTYRPGESAVTVRTPLAVLGLTICYDMRFPALYRTLAQAGAEVIAVPSAFTVPTGRAHWHVLLRARAIETGCFIVAPAQVGEHAEGRRTYGHSLIVAPWGEVLADGGDAPGIVTAEIDTARVAEARARVPSLSGDRPFDLPPVWSAAAE